MAEYHRLLIQSYSGPIWNYKSNFVPATQNTDVVFDGSEMICPDCGGVLDLAEGSVLEDVTCRSCGSRFAPVNKSDHVQAGDTAPTPGSGDGMPGQGRHWKLPPR